MLPGPFWSTIFDDELSLCRSSSSYHFAMNTRLLSSLCRTRGSINLTLHHFFCLMSSLIDYIFMKPLDKCVVIIINILRSSKICIEFLMRNSILCPRWFGLSLTTLLYSLQHKTCSCFVLYLEFLAIQLMLCSTAEYYHLWCQECCEDCSTS